MLRIREPVSKVAAVLLPFLPFVIVAGLWFWATAGPEPEARRVSLVMLPSPAETVESIPSLWYERELSRAVVLSLRRVVIGYAIAAAIALPLGIAMGAFGAFRAMFSPLAVIGGYLPIAALVPLTMMWWGIEDQQKYGFLAIACFVYMLPLVVRAVEQVDDAYVLTAQAQGGSQWQVLSKVLVPIAAPDIYRALHLGFGVGWTWIILAEVVNAENGIGFIITMSQRRGPPAHVYLSLIVVIVIAFVVDRIWVLGRQQLFPYKVEA